MGARLWAGSVSINRRKTGFTLPIRDWLVEEQNDPSHVFGMRPWALFLYQQNIRAV